MFNELIIILLVFTNCYLFYLGICNEMVIFFLRDNDYLLAYDWWRIEIVDLLTK